ncbi:MAG: L-lysine 6-transaminase [Labilithrix sp.]|nr:L-lysine 6-transaminase [Labilithrix sp.]MCW5831570.1 L-lysine 6-transaminase [Labilithrix sp.]
MFRRSQIPSAEVHATLRRHILVDGYPLVIDLEKSSGSVVRDATSGRELLDFYSFFASNPLGFNHPGMLDERTRERLARTSIVKVANSDKYTTYFAEFVDTLARTAAPAELSKYFFVEGGALAVENALKTAFDWKVRKNLAAGRGERGYQILHLERAFHGRSGYTLSLTNTDPNKTAYFPKFDWPRIPSPMIRFPLTGGNVAEVEERERAAVAAAEAAFARAPHEIAAIILEPIQGEGGDNHFRPSFFSELRRLADEHEALLIYDEVQTGLGGTGAWWAYQHHGVKPDIVCFAKKMQVGGILVSDRIDDVEDNVFHKPGRINSTWGGGLVDMVRATRILEIIVEEKLIENAAARGAELLAGLEGIQARRSSVDNARGKGLMCAIDVPDSKTRDAVIKRCFADGMLVLACGQRSIRFRPALNVGADVIADAVARLEAAIAAVCP